MRTVEEAMPPVRTACRGLPDELADAIERCLEKRKRGRIPSARAREWSPVDDLDQ